MYRCAYTHLSVRCRGDHIALLFILPWGCRLVTMHSTVYQEFLMVHVRPRTSCAAAIAAALGTFPVKVTFITVAVEGRTEYLVLYPGGYIKCS